MKLPAKWLVRTARMLRTGTGAELFVIHIYKKNPNSLLFLELAGVRLKGQRSFFIARDSQPKLNRICNHAKERLDFTSGIVGKSLLSTERALASHPCFQLVCCRLALFLQQDYLISNWLGSAQCKDHLRTRPLMCQWNQSSGNYVWA